MIGCLRACAVALSATVVISARAGGGDWPQWRGQNRDGAIVAFTAPPAWPDRLTRKWKVDVGLGYSSPVLVGNRLYSYSRRGDNEVLAALDADTGREIWQHSDAAPFTVNSAAARH